MKKIYMIYGIEATESALAMMGAGWTGQDTAEEIMNAHEDVPLEEAELMAEIIRRIEEESEEE